MNLEDFKNDGQKAIEKFQPILKAMFPDFQVNMTVRTGFGTTFWIDIVSPHKVTRRNADVNLSFMIFQSDTIPSLEKSMCLKKYKFRKVNGNSIDDIVSKFMIWIAKKEDEIKYDWVSYK